MLKKISMIAATAVFALTGAAQAATIFEDNFDNEALELNASLDKWTVAPGSVDVIGPGGPFDFYPGNGNYLDMNGSSVSEGKITTTGSLGLVLGKKYTLTFSYGANTSTGAPPIILSFGLGGATQTIVFNTQPPSLVSAVYTFVYDDSGDYLFFADTSGTPNDQGGPVLDNVKLSAVPLPAGGLLLLGALGGIAALRRRRKAA